MAAWGVVVPPGKTVPFVPPPDGGRLHLSQATLVPPSPSASCGRALLFARAGEHGAEVAVASLRGDGKGAECVGLDLIFDEYTEFRVDVGGDTPTAAAGGQGGGKGGAAAPTIPALPCIHLTGYHLPDFGDDTGSSDEEEEASDDEEVLASSDDEDAPLAVPIGGASLSDGDDGEDDDSDALSESEGEEEERAAARRAQGVVIEELPNEGGHTARAMPSAAGSDDDSEDESGSESGESSGSDVSSDGDDASDASDDEPDADAPVSAPEWGKEGGAPAGKRKAGDVGAPPAKKGAAATVAAPATPAPAATTKQAAKPPPPKPDPSSKVRRYDNGFVVEELAPGRPAGKRVTPGARVDVRYTGKLAKTGKVFDSTKGASTFTFRCGVGEVIKAWDRGVAGAVEGAKLRITAPPAMAYGASGVRGAIPGNATLVFDVEVVRVR